jgi:hypothetical protein
MKKDEMSGARSMRARNEKCIQNFRRKTKRMRPFRRQDVDGRIILK